MTVFKCILESDSGSLVAASSIAITNEEDNYPVGMGDAIGECVLSKCVSHAPRVLMEAARFVLQSGAITAGYTNERFFAEAMEGIVRCEKAVKKMRDQTNAERANAGLPPIKFHA